MTKTHTDTHTRARGYSYLLYQTQHQHSVRIMYYGRIRLEINETQYQHFPIAIVIEAMVRVLSRLDRDHDRRRSNASRVRTSRAPRREDDGAILSSG